MARHHRHAVQPAEPGPAATPAPASGGEAPPLSLGWRVALVVWALGLGGLVLVELGGLIVRMVRSGG